MKVYNVISVPYGDLKYDTRTIVLGTYFDKKKALERALAEVERDVNEIYEFDVKKEDLENFELSNCLKVFWKYIGNYNAYYELLIIENEEE